VAIRFRFLTIPIVATLAMLVCFWSAEILLAVYASLLPFYVIPGESPYLSAAKDEARQCEPG
jgi:hypothetical protein